MIKNYFMVAVRSLSRQKVYSFINIFGLAVGLACSIVITLYIQDELSYDRFQEKKERIYQVVSDVRTPKGRIMKLATNGWPVGRLLKAEFPEVEQVAYLRSWPTFSIKHKGRYFFENILWADTAFFDIFSFPLIRGNPQTALRDPFSVVVTEQFAQKYFATRDALGRTLVLNDSLLFTITGVVHLPSHSHIRFDVLISLSTYCILEPEKCAEAFTNGWYEMNMFNYLLLRDHVDGDAFRRKIADLAQRHAGTYFQQIGYSTRLRLQPLTDIYLRSDRGNRLGPSGDIDYVYLLSAIALFVLLIACVNFVNLANARSAQRAKEVGIRKVVGANRNSLIRQFLGESLLTTLVALALALLLLDLFLPIFKQLSGKAFTINELATLRNMLFIFGLVVIVGALAGLYPAFLLSGFHPIETLKGRHVPGHHGVRLRQALVIFQFAVSCILIVGTLVVIRQLRYMQSRNLGFDKDQVLVVDARQTPGAVRARQYETIKQELKKHPAILHVSATNAVPGRSGWREQFAFPEGWAQDQGLSLEYIPVDYDFVETMGLKLEAGRDFSPDFDTDLEQAVLINEAAVKTIGWKTPQEAVGKHLSSPGSGKSHGIVIGVVKDYHHHGLQEKIGPIMFGINLEAFGYFALRLDPEELSSILPHIKKVWNTFFSGYPLHYFFLDEDYDQQYREQERLRSVFGVFAMLSIVIACLGLLGLAAFTAERRTKEIGIRKVLGATETDVVALLSREFVRLVLLANLIAWPVAYYAMNCWLQNFAYRIEIEWWVFVLASGLALVIALVTVGTQAVRTALRNPVETLRYE